MDPFQRFIGVDASARPEQLLGLDPGPHSRLTIENALQTRLEQVFRHPDASSDEAETVRHRLRQAAALLIDRATSKRSARPTAGASRPSRLLSAHARRGSSAPAQPFERLTEFDRYVLAILVSCGGWNATSRQRLVGLAHSYGVSPMGLVKVVGGLSDYARSGGPPLNVRQMTAGQRPLVMPPAPAHETAEQGTDLAARLTPELKEDSVWSTIKLSVLFALITVMFGVVLMRLIITADERGGTTEVPAQVRESVAPAETRRPADVRTEAPQRRPALFTSLPTFVGNARPMEAVNAADRSVSLPQQFDEVARKLAVAADADRVSEAVYQNWKVSIETIASGWVLVDDSTRAAIRRTVFEALYETRDIPTVGDRLVRTLRPPARLAQPTDIWRGAWMSGMLAAILASDDLPPSIAEFARTELVVALDRFELDPEIEGFEQGADAWLRHAAASLVAELEYREDPVDTWEMWIAAQRELGEDGRLNAAVMDAVARILRTPTDLSRPGPSVDVLGRLLTLADFQSCPVVREKTLALFEPSERIIDHDLWVLTSLLAQLDTAPWFNEQLILPAEGGERFRSRIRDRIARAWPAIDDPGSQDAAAAGALSVDRSAAERWLALVGEVDGQPIDPTNAQRLERLVTWSRLNEVAVMLAARKTGEAETRMSEVADALASSDDRSARRPPSSSRTTGVSGTDGVWSETYAEARRNTDSKLRALQQLRRRADRDLGPIDAETFVREIYLGSPREVRELARSILLEQFASGSNVSMEMLDQFPDAPRNEALASAIRRYANRVLPSVRSETWPVEARLALVEHALSLRRGGPSRLDGLSEDIRTSYVQRLATLRDETTSRLVVRTPEDAAALLADHWRERARRMMISDPFPDSVGRLEQRRDIRRELNDGPIQQFVTDQIAILEYLAFITAAEQPDVRDGLRALLATSAQQRDASSHVLEQALSVERTMSAIWAIRMGLANQPLTSLEVQR
jgi:hypothetical protein